VWWSYGSVCGPGQPWEATLGVPLSQRHRAGPGGSPHSSRRDPAILRRAVNGRFLVSLRLRRSGENLCRDHPVSKRGGDHFCRIGAGVGKTARLRREAAP
ncbi:unnamed protein product, partial [Symbiodinium necroappetens]